MYFDALAQKYHFSLDAPICQPLDGGHGRLLYGTHGEKLTLHYERGTAAERLEQAFEGIIPNIERRCRETQSEAMRKESRRTCPPPPARTAAAAPVRCLSRVTVGGLSITEFCDMSSRTARWHS